MTSLLRTHGWRIALVPSGIAMLAGGPRHPEADAEGSLREELATMTAHPDWVPAHTFIASTATPCTTAARHRSRSRTSG